MPTSPSAPWQQPRPTKAAIVEHLGDDAAEDERNLNPRLEPLAEITPNDIKLAGTGALKPHSKQMALLHLAGASDGEIGEILGVPVGAVKLTLRSPLAKAYIAMLLEPIEGQAVEMHSLLRGLAAEAIEVMADLLSDDTTDAKERRIVAQDILDRAGFKDRGFNEAAGDVYNQLNVYGMTPQQVDSFLLDRLEAFKAANRQRKNDKRVKGRLTR